MSLVKHLWLKLKNRLWYVFCKPQALESLRYAIFKEYNTHSEIVAINPRVKGLIAKVEKQEDCPPEFLNFAKTYNLPIILMKPSE